MKSLLDVYFSFYTEDPHCWGGAAAPGRPPRSPSPNTPAHAQSFGAMVSPKVPAAVAAPTPDPRVRPPVLRGACPARPPVPACAVFCTPRRRCPASGARIVCAAPRGPLWAPSFPVFAKCIAKMLSAILGETPPTARFRVLRAVLYKFFRLYSTSGPLRFSLDVPR